jgi:hypothetical protein
MWSGYNWLNTEVLFSGTLLQWVKFLKCYIMIWGSLVQEFMNFPNFYMSSSGNSEIR